MFETRLVLRPTRFALETPALQRDYDECWAGFENHFRMNILGGSRNSDYPAALRLQHRPAAGDRDQRAGHVAASSLASST